MADYTLEKPLPTPTTCIRSRLDKGLVMWALEGEHAWMWIGHSNDRVCKICGYSEHVPHGGLA